MTYTEKELDQFLHGISLSLLSKKSAQHWRYDEETAKEIEWLEALERKVRADKADRKTEPTISKMEQVDEPKTQAETQNSNLTFEKADERKCIDCNFLTYMFGKTWCNIKCENPHDKVCDRFKPKDEPQTELVRVKYHCINCAENGSYKCSKCDGEMYYKYDKDEPQTDCAWR